MNVASFKRAAAEPGSRAKLLAGRETVLHKDVALPATATASRTFRFTISTANIDRDQDTISVTGWDLSAFLRNPVVLWNHGKDANVGTWPIGRAVDVKPDGGVLKASVIFDPADMPITGPAAEACVRKLQNGSLAATSVGFRPLEYSVSDDPARDPTGWMPGIDFKRQELLELSIVAIPANSEALLIPTAELDDVPRGRAPPTQAAASGMQTRATAKPLPPAPLAGWKRPHDMTELDRLAETTTLRAWLDLTKGRWLTAHQRSEAEVLRERLAYLERGFR